MTARIRLTFAAFAVLAISVSGAAVAGAQDLQGQVDEKEAELQDQREEKGVLTDEIASLSTDIAQLEGEISVLRTREATVLNELEATRSRLHSARDRLAGLRRRYHRSIGVLEQRLVAIYKQDEPDALTVILQADGFDDMIERYEYLNRIEDQDSTIISRVRDLKTETKDTVDEIEEAKAAIAAKKRELARTRSQLEAREGDLTAARQDKTVAVGSIDQNIEKLEGDIDGLEDQIQEQLQAAAQEQAASGAVPADLPAGPVQGGSQGFIWPVNGSVVSPFGMRWGRMHEGVDIAVPAGTPIRAAKAGAIALAAPTGGYGNYTCVNHGGGLSTCYAHQSSFAITSGSVDQGDVIGYVGCTGHCFGDHLHFEVRINGAAVDPMGYL
ncbi:MAG TPA: peptidoglycan DD-metalloendopeptidase family protein [Solirubrobacterales bacterium]